MLATENRKWTEEIGKPSKILRLTMLTVDESSGRSFRTPGSDTLSDDSEDVSVISAKLVLVPQPTVGPSCQTRRSSTENPGNLPAKAANEQIETVEGRDDVDVEDSIKNFRYVRNQCY